MATPLFSIEPVIKTVTVACTPEEAFRYFTADFAMWWPIATHSVVAHTSQFRDKPAIVIFEPYVRGRIFERAHAGEEHTWGSVLTWQPPARIAFSFHPGRDEVEGQTVEVMFSAAPEGTTSSSCTVVGRDYVPTRSKRATASIKDGKAYSSPLTPNI